MTQHPLELFRGQKGTGVRPEPRRSLDGLDAAKLAKHLLIYRPEADEIARLLDLARASIPHLAEAQIVQKVARFHPDCFWGIAHKGRDEASKASGFAAMLPLNDQGLGLLACKEFDGSNPDLSLLARPHEKPAGIYFWALYAPGPLSGGLALFMELLSTSLYGDVDIFSCPNTDAGHRFNLACGLKKGATIDGVLAPHLYVHVRPRRLSNTPPLYDSHHQDHRKGELSVTLARTFEDLLRVASVRAAVYIGEQRCPYEEEFDGNDLSATHLLGYVGDEPAGCMRVRYFADFAKIERLAVRTEFRHTRLSFQLVRAGIELCRMKGYHRLYGHAQKRLVNFWGRFGFVPLKDRPEFVFSDFDYVEIVAELKPNPDAIAIGKDPYLIIRPEGRWHVPGILECSSVRAVTRPSVN